MNTETTLHFWVFNSKESDDMNRCRGTHKQTNNINNKRNMKFFFLRFLFPYHSTVCVYINSNINCSRVFIPKIDSHHRYEETERERKTHTHISLLYIEWQLNLMINCCIFCELNFYLGCSAVYCYCCCCYCRRKTVYHGTMR